MSSDGADVTSSGRLFQTWGPATGKALLKNGGPAGLWLDEAASVGGANTSRLIQPQFYVNVYF